MLQQFVQIYFPEYRSSQAFASLWDLLLASQQHAAPPNSSSNNSATDAPVSAIELTFESLARALKQDASARLLVTDACPLAPAQTLSVARHDDELALPQLQPTAALQRTSLPAFPRAANVAASAPLGRHSLASHTSNISRALDSMATTVTTPLLQDFHTEVLKKSRNWLGRWQTRYLFLRWNELEICKKNISVHAAAPIAGSSTSSRSATSATSAAAQAAAKSKRYPLETLLSIQLVQLNESDPLRKQALSLHFKQPTAHGGQTTKSLLLGCDRSAQLKTVALQLATFALVYGVATGQDAASLHKFLHLGANLDVYCVVPSPAAPPCALAPLQLAFVAQSPPATLDATVQLLVRSGADPRSVLRFAFASHVLFPTLSSRPDDAALATARRQLLVRESIDGVVFPFGSVVGDDEHQWTLLMYLSACGDVATARTLLATLYKLSKSKCLQYVDHVNAAGDNALHIAIKSSARATEDVAMLLVDVGTNSASVLAPPALPPTTVSTLSSEPSAPPALTASTSSVESQLVHCCDGSGASACHLALKAQLWRLVDKLVDAKAIDPTSCDRFGNSALHVAIKVGAPVPLLARLIQLYRPHRASAFSSMRSERSQLVTTLGFDGRDRRANDTALTLALKHRQQDVVELLLAAGASPNVSECRWTIESPGATATSAIGDSDTPLHVAIKTGQARAAMALVAHGASLAAVDANGASALALAIRYGMYALSRAIAERMATETTTSAREAKHWVDGETGAPVGHVAVQAGQIELLALLLDAQRSQVRGRHATTHETLLHVLVKNVVWLSLSVSSGGDDRHSASDDALHDGDGALDTSSQRQFHRAMRSPSKRTRRRVKSRSDGDLRYLRPMTAAASPPSLSKASSSDSVDTGARTTTESRDRVAFVQTAIEALMRRILQLADDDDTSVAVVSRASTAQTPFHLATSPPLVVTNHSGDAYSPLHAAAAGGDATTATLALLLAFVEARGSQRAMAQALGTTAGASAETPLHAALAANASANALLLLAALERAQDAASASSEEDTADTAALCSRVLDASTVPSGATALHFACRWPRSPRMLAVVDALLRHDVFASGWDADGVAPLHVAVTHACDDRLVRVFKRHGQDLNVWTEGRGDFSPPTASGDTSSDADALKALATAKTPLMLAIEHENAAAVRALVSSGAPVRVVTPQTRLGLLHAAMHARVTNRALIQTLLASERLVAFAVTDCFGRTTEDAVAWLSAQLAAPRTTRETSAVAEEDERDVDDDDEVAAASAVSVDVSVGVVRRSDQTREALASSQAPVANDVPGSGRRSSGVLAQQSEAQSPSSQGHRRASDSAPSASLSTRAAIPPLNSVAVSVARPFGTASPPRAAARCQDATAHLRSLPPAPTLDAAVVEYLREEERATLTLVAHEARQEAQDWLKKRIGQKKLLSDARAQLQKQHRRSASGSLVPLPLDASGGPETESSSTLAFGRESERLVEQYKALAAKRFIDKHVAEAVAEARMEIEREKQAIWHETGLFPGTTAAPASDARHRRDGLRRTPSMNSSLLLAPASSYTGAGGVQRSESTVTIGSDDSNGAGSVWWSERGASSVYDDLNATWLSAAAPGGRSGTMLSESWNGTWLSSVRGTAIEYRDTRLSGTFQSFLEPDGPMSADAYGTSHDRLAGSYVADTALRDDDDDEHWELDGVVNPLDLDSFAHVIETRKSLT